jgi:type III secretion protein V
LTTLFRLGLEVSATGLLVLRADAGEVIRAFGNFVVAGNLVVSIDAERRAGHIDHNEARRRRAALARESQLFGSMDGAMKFVIVPRLPIRPGARRFALRHVDGAPAIG